MKYRIIGNMTGNSMDAVDLVLTEFDGDKMKDICSFSKAYTKQMQAQMESLRARVKDKTKSEILALPEFKNIHDAYVQSVADAVNAMCEKYAIDKKTISAIGFHGKTLDHNPPSKAKADGTSPYTLQIGSGQMLANLTGIPVVYDFRSAPLMAGFDGAPLVPPHNAHIAATEGDGCYYNGGNTSNFAWVVGGVAQVGADAGPFNEYVDNFIRENTKDSFDKNGKYGSKGKLHKAFLKVLFDIGRTYYERALPKSGDPQYYHKDEVFKTIKKLKVTFNDAVHTLEYFAAYIAVQALTLTDKKIKLPPHFILFGGGWKNPVVRKSFDDLVAGKGYVLPEHEKQFKAFLGRFAKQPTVKYSAFGEMMEARLFAELARYKLDNKPWEIPEIVKAGKKVVCGVVVKPNKQKVFADKVNLAAKGWQGREKMRQNKRSKGLK
ncbi:MAG: anhydro-N-acetylmuramic acid kinase [Alphaproteobacteria bacterium]|nr:anhydro-N-acetylmuramic acid kinase [Alphaproteobacteria bacterium]